MLVLDYLTSVKDFFAYNKVSPESETIAYVLDQLPSFTYDGSSITVAQESPIYLHNRLGQILVAIDVHNKLSYSERSKIPFILTGSNLLLSMIRRDDNGDKALSLPISYNQILGSSPGTFDKESIKQQISTLIDKLSRTCVYIVMPILLFKNFINTLLDNAIIVLIGYSMFGLLFSKIELKTCIRMTMFASGIDALISPIIDLAMPQFNMLPVIIKAWSAFLLGKGTLAIHRNNR